MSRMRENVLKNPPLRDNQIALYFPDVGGTFIEYICYAEPWNKNEGRKTVRADYVWQITKYTKVGNFITEAAWADGDASFNKSADLRESYDYTIG